MSKQSWRGSTLLNPEPPVLVSCGGLEKPNLITIGWTGTICTQPSMVSISVRPERYSHHLIQESGQFAINLPTEALVRSVDWCGVKSGRDVDKFAACGLHSAPGSVLTDCPILEESPVNLECKVTQVIPLGSHDLFLAEVVVCDVDESLLDENGKLCFSIRSGGKTYTYYEDTPVYPSDVWADIEHMHQRDPERTGYATQKPEALLRRIISASCPEGGLVADLFGGSGTTAAVAAKLNRRFLTIDASPASLGIVRKRLLSAGCDVSLIKQSSALALSYPALPEGEFDADFTFSRDAFGAYVQLDSFRSKFGLSFMAFGTVGSDGIFRPAEYTLFPTVGSRLSDSACKADTVQLCDNAGGMRFYRV